MNSKIVCIVEDKNDLREAMELMVQLSEAYILGGSYKNAEEALQYIPTILPDAVLMDINLPSLSGIDCVNSLKASYPNMLFLMCTAYEENDKIFDSLKAGASGYILKTDGPQKIIEALTDMLNGGSPMSSTIARKVVASFTNVKAKSLQQLTEKEAIVLEAIAKGLMNKEIAYTLHISEGTVRKHIQHIYEKLQVNTRVEAVNLLLNR